MGKGSNSGNNTATKQARASGTGTGGGGMENDQSADLCLFQFTERLLLSDAGAVKVGDKVAIIPNAVNPGKLDVVIGGGRYGEYTGQNLQRLLQCINNKYSYTGAVGAVTALGNGVEAVCTIKGHKYEPTTSL